MTHVLIKDLTRRFDSVIAVNNLNLEIESGEMVAFLGPSGCGKTTTLRMITGLLLPTSGDVLFDSKSVLTIPTEKRGAVMVFQKHLLFPTMNVAKNIGFGLRMAKMPQKEIDRRVSEMLELVRLPGFETRRPHELSGGQQQRIALARALIVRPNVLLLDEPLANLDANLRLEMRELIRTIQNELNTTAIFVTHDQEEAVMLADRIALMFNGVLQQFDTPQAFYERPNSAQVARFFRNDNMILGTRRGSVVETPSGNLEIDAGRVDQSDGPVMVTVRPEDVALVPSDNTNLVQAKVLTQVYMGTHKQVQLDVMGHTWLAHGPADFEIEVGQTLPIQLPKTHIWLLPSENGLQNV
ncbi:MAG: ABC transporter ATP-binding protein [Anaerolineaceae bacterium]|nr:ABC transporter ATP-binding protein [Anaerolineaceae bacterium]